jgi:hypothetical protein
MTTGGAPTIDSHCPPVGWPRPARAGHEAEHDEGRREDVGHGRYLACHRRGARLASPPTPALTHAMSAAARSAVCQSTPIVISRNVSKQARVAQMRVVHR